MTFNRWTWKRPHLRLQLVLLFASVSACLPSEELDEPSKTKAGHTGTGGPMTATPPSRTTPATASALLCDGLMVVATDPRTMDAWVSSRQAEFDSTLISCAESLVYRFDKVAEDYSKACQNLPDIKQRIDCERGNESRAYLSYTSSMWSVATTKATWSSTHYGMGVLRDWALCESYLGPQACSPLSSIAEADLRRAYCASLDCTR
jgi:hypothetical protein